MVNVERVSEEERGVSEGGMSVGREEQVLCDTHILCIRLCVHYTTKQFTGRMNHTKSTGTPQDVASCRKGV